jgi:hypothetical protein
MYSSRRAVGAAFCDACMNTDLRQLPVCASSPLAASLRVRTKL